MFKHASSTSHFENLDVDVYMATANAVPPVRGVRTCAWGGFGLWVHGCMYLHRLTRVGRDGWEHSDTHEHRVGWDGRRTEN